MIIMAKKEKIGTLNIILITVVAILSLFIILDKVIEARQYGAKEVLDKNIEAIVVDMMQKTNNCGTYTIFIGNESRTLIDMQCGGIYYQQGISDSLFTIYNETNDCKIVPITVANQTRNLVDYSTCVEPYLTPKE